jgi:hypothetical protein
MKKFYFGFMMANLYWGKFLSEYFSIANQFSLHIYLSYFSLRDFKINTSPWE